jgi:O-antigen/teichoic acid export membrane protein
LPTGELAIFGVCTRVFSLVSFGVAAVYAVTLPDIVESDAIKDRAGFLRKIKEANIVASGLAVLLLGLVVIGAPIAFMFFGPAFQAGVGPLAILCVGLVLRAIFGPASIMLSVHNRPYATLPAVAAAMTTLVVADIALVPSLGLMGAAVAALLGMTVWSGALWFTALKVAGVDVSIRMRPGTSVKTLVAERVE